MCMVCSHTELGLRYRSYVDYMARTLRPLFWDPEHSMLRCVTLIKNVTLSPFDPQQQYTPDGDCLLDDPYEGGGPSVLACPACLSAAFCVKAHGCCVWFGVYSLFTEPGASC